MKILERYFLLFILFLSISAFFAPAIFVVLLPYLSYLLALVMLFMGITLKKEDLMSAFKNWKFALLGTFLQFALMPSLAYFIGIALQLPLEYKLGLLLVGTCPGGTASNVIVYLFKGDVSLSVLMTTMSTLLSVILTPILLEFYLGTQMELPVQKMMLDIFTLVILPLVLGFLVKKWLKITVLDVLEKSASIVAIVVIALIIAAIVAANSQTVKSIPYILFLAVVLHNGLGYLLGYLLSRLFTSNVTIARTIAIEVGMQNSGLGVVLANLHFSKMVALPSAIFSFWHNVSGISLANYWKRNT